MTLMSLRPRSQRLCVALMLCAGLCGQSLAQQAQSPPSGRPASASVKAPPGGPAWSELTADQRRSLAPLAGSWAQISEPQKRKWIAMAGNFSKMTPTEQAKLHSRMTEWAALSPQQRAQARLNFGETQQLSPEEKKAKWEAYQALPPEEKRKLADGVERKPPTTAAAVKPVAPQKLATLPRAPSDEGVKPPRIVAVPPGESVEPTH
jgi:hypothetical protein